MGSPWYGGYSVELWRSRADELSVQTGLQARVWEELSWEPLVDASNLTVRVVDYVAKLSGTVPSYPARLAAEHAAKRVEHLQGVENHIRIELPAQDWMDDAAVRRNVEHALRSDVRVRHAPIEATVESGCVALSGVVEREFEREAAEEVVRYLAGVRDVRNAIAVRDRSEAQVARDLVEASLRRRSALRGDRIRLTTREGHLEMHGHVRSLAEREEAERAAREVLGTDVEDNLTVRR